MKKVILSIFLYQFLALHLNASSLTPLKKYCEDHNLKEDNFALGYVTLRCGSLFPYIAGIIDKKIEKNENVYHRKNDVVKKYLKYSSSLLKLSSKYMQEKPKEITEMAASILKIYAKDANANYLKSGNYIKGSYIENDLNICKTFVSD